MKRLLCVYRKSTCFGTDEGWVCYLCGTHLNHYSLNTGWEAFWCPTCDDWVRIDQFLDRLFRTRKILKVNNLEKIESISLAAMMKKMDIFIARIRAEKQKEMKIWTSDEYSQEFLRSLIPSLRPNYK